MSAPPIVAPTSFALNIGDHTARFSAVGTGIFDHRRLDPSAIKLQEMLELDWPSRYEWILTAIGKVLIDLSQLGDDRAMVARVLRKLAIQGDISCGRCPVAIYLKRRNVLAPSVFPDTVGFWANQAQTVRVIMDTPPPIESFIRGFDNGQLARDLFVSASHLAPWEREN